MAKQYIDYMKEISKDELYEGLLGYGLFCDKLPPIFTSESFYLNNKNHKIKKLKPKEKLRLNNSDYIRYNSIRNTNVPRLIGVPNPFAYLRLCAFLRDNWTRLVSYFYRKTKNQKYKRSQIHLQKIKNKKHLFELNRNYHDKDQELEFQLCHLPILKKYQVDADISSCFPSIYSHALSWAYAGKSTAKKHRYDNKFFNQIDQYSRSIKNGETNGLLIGPHTSNLLSEIILCAVDQKLLSTKKYEYIRHIDDYTCFVESEDEAEKFILELSNILKEYELTLNPRKTKISHLPLTSSVDWISELRNFYINDLRDNTKKDSKTNNKPFFPFQRLKAYLDLSIRLANENKNSAIYSYAIKVIADHRLGEKSLSYYLATVHQLVCLYPYLVHWLDRYIFDEFNTPKDEIRNIANDLYIVGKNKNNYEACVYAIYWHLKCGIEADFQAKYNHNYTKDAIRSGDCIFLIMAMLLANCRNDHDSTTKLKDHATKLAKNNFYQYWLFIYEILSANEMKQILIKNCTTLIQKNSSGQNSKNITTNQKTNLNNQNSSQNPETDDYQNFISLKIKGISFIKNDLPFLSNTINSKSHIEK